MKVTKRFVVRSVLGAAAAVALSGVAWAQGAPIKNGRLATLEGPCAAGGADGMRGAELALIQRGGMVAGRKVEIIKGSSNANPDVAVNATRKLVDLPAPKSNQPTRLYHHPRCGKWSLLL